MSVCIPFFNEEADELERMLKCLHTEACRLADLGIQLHVLAISDGWFKASKSMKEYLPKLLPHETFWQRLEDDEQGKQLSGTFFIQRVVSLDEDAREMSHISTGGAPAANTGGLAPVSLETKDGHHVQIRFSLMVKMVNKGKHNGQAWFLESFMPFYNRNFEHKYVFPALALLTKSH